MSLVVDNWKDSIALCQHVLNELTDKVNVLKSSLDFFNESQQTLQQLKRYEEFYNSFQLFLLSIIISIFLLIFRSFFKNRTLS